MTPRDYVRILVGAAALAAGIAGLIAVAPAYTPRAEGDPIPVTVRRVTELPHYRLIYVTQGNWTLTLTEAQVGLLISDLRQERWQ